MPNSPFNISGGKNPEYAEKTHNFQKINSSHISNIHLRGKRRFCQQINTILLRTNFEAFSACNEEHYASSKYLFRIQKRTLEKSRKIVKVEKGFQIFNFQSHIFFLLLLLTWQCRAKQLQDIFTNKLKLIQQSIQCGSWRFSKTNPLGNFSWINKCPYNSLYNFLAKNTKKLRQIVSSGVRECSGNCDN